MGFERFALFLRKDMLLLARGPEQILTTLFFVLLTVLLVHFGFGVEKPFAAVWLATVFGFALRLNRSYDPENEGRVWAALKTIPGVASPFFFAKATTNFAYALLLEAAAFVLVIMFYNPADPLHFVRTALFPLTAGALGLSFIGTTFAGLLGAEGKRDLLLPVIFYPIAIPLVVAVFQCLDMSADGTVLGLNPDWVKFLCVFDVIYVVASYLVFDYLMEGSS